MPRCNTMGKIMGIASDSQLMYTVKDPSMLPASLLKTLKVGHGDKQMFLILCGSQGKADR